MTEPEYEPKPNDLTRWISVALWVWGVILAIGAYTLNHNIYRPVVVLACVGLFQGFWRLMLASRRNREDRSSRKNQQTPL